VLQPEWLSFTQYAALGERGEINLSWGQAGRCCPNKIRCENRRDGSPPPATGGVRGGVLGEFKLTTPPFLPSTGEGSPLLAFIAVFDVSLDCAQPGTLAHMVHA